MCKLRSALFLVTLLGACREKGGETAPDAPEPAPRRSAEPEPWQPDGTLDTDAFAWGLAVGDATQTTARVGLRTTEPEVSLQLMVADGDNWLEVETIDGLVASEEIVQTDLSDLEPDTAYSLVFRAGDRRSLPGRFRTALPDDAWRVLQFGATSCLDRPDAPWPTLSLAAGERFDFFAQLGDTVYADDAVTLEDYRAYWRETFSTQGLLDLNTSTSTIATWDDHELENNWTWDDITQEQYDAAYQAYVESMPQTSGPGGSGIWRELSWGRVADVFVLDSRGERGGGNYVSVEQMDWLKEGLSASDARFKLILNSVPITDLTAIFGVALEEDRWQGYPEQRSEIVEYIADNGLEGVLWLTGDVHYPAVCHVDPKGSPGWDQWEVFTGPSGSTLNVAASLYAGDEQYPIIFAEWNYVRFEADPGTGEVKVEFVGDDGVVMAETVLEL